MPSALPHQHRTARLLVGLQGERRPDPAKQVDHAEQRDHGAAQIQDGEGRESDEDDEARIDRCFQEGTQFVRRRGQA